MAPFGASSRLRFDSTLLDCFVACPLHAPPVDRGPVKVRTLSIILISAICLTTAAIASNCLTKPETSAGSTPLPEAIRRRWRRR